MIIIYLFYVRDQISRIFLNVETVCIDFRSHSLFYYFILFQIVCTHSHGDDQILVSLSTNYFYLKDSYTVFF